MLACWWIWKSKLKIQNSINYYCGLPTRGQDAHSLNKPEGLRPRDLNPEEGEWENPYWEENHPKVSLTAKPIQPRCLWPPKGEISGAFLQEDAGDIFFLSLCFVWVSEKSWSPKWRLIFGRISSTHWSLSCQVLLLPVVGFPPCLWSCLIVFEGGHFGGLATHSSVQSLFMGSVLLVVLGIPYVMLGIQLESAACTFSPVLSL